MVSFIISLKKKTSIPTETPQRMSVDKKNKMLLKSMSSPFLIPKLNCLSIHAFIN